MEADETAKKSELKNKKYTLKKRTKPTEESKKLKEEIIKLKKQTDEINDKYIRVVAEFDNYKKRTDKEYISLIQNANEKLIADLLPTVDDLERSLDHLKKENDFETLTKGFQLIYKNFMSVLEKQGLIPLQAIGKDFDPEKHDALLQTEKKGVESNKVINEHLKGYILNDKVIRHAQVIVSK